MQRAARGRFAAIAQGEALPERAFAPGSAELFLYSAIIWNAHRIHYDAAYVREEEGYPGLLITGPLQGDWLCQAVTDWMGEDGTLERFEFSHRQPAYLGQTLTTGGRVLAKEAATGRVTLALEVRNEAGAVVTPGQAVVRFALD
jgi:hydroxyacyl-ACP dehydratase HTD2-like protein with hotdog domain